MEVWDLYDKNGKKSGNKHRRGDPLKDGEFHLVVENWIKNNKNEILIQKRTRPLGNYKNPWSTTAGAAVSGESSIIAVQRETQEEVGLFFEYRDIKFIERSFFEDFFMDVYETKWNGNIKNIVFDHNEVAEVKWVTQAEINEMFKSKEFYSHETNYLLRLLEHTIA